jgi:hypothetical protein
MPQAQPITLTDDSGDETIYSPMTVGNSKLFSTAPGSSITSAGQHDLSQEISRASRSRTSDHVKMKLLFPVEHTVDEITQVASTPSFEGKFVFPDTLSEQQRKDIRVKVSTLFTDSLFAALCDKLEPAY